jgi:hypothetical protein
VCHGGLVGHPREGRRNDQCGHHLRIRTPSSAYRGAAVRPTTETVRRSRPDRSGPDRAGPDGDRRHQRRLAATVEHSGGGTGHHIDTRTDHEGSILVAVANGVGTCDPRAPRRYAIARAPPGPTAVIDETGRTPAAVGVGRSVTDPVGAASEVSAGAPTRLVGRSVGRTGPFRKGSRLRRRGRSRGPRNDVRSGNRSSRRFRRSVGVEAPACSEDPWNRSLPTRSTDGMLPSRWPSHRRRSDSRRLPVVAMPVDRVAYGRPDHVRGVSTGRNHRSPEPRPGADPATGSVVVAGGSRPDSPPHPDPIASRSV